MHQAFLMPTVLASRLALVRLSQVAGIVSSPG